ncbi:ATP-binding protein [Halalkalibaculum sp. DA384]|uniref:ATP-binding protein n=1 Tax=Halalkalibaculum sp. DA384 TaxID=3373606 RepID=UPI003754915D
MSIIKQINPYEEERKIGFVTEVGSSYVKANINENANQYDDWYLGIKNSQGHVNDFVVIDCDEYALLGRISKSTVLDVERLKLNENSKGRVHPIGNIQLLATISLQNSEVLKGILAYPKVGASVYTAHPDFVKWTFEFDKLKDSDKEKIKLQVGHLPEHSSISIDLTPEQLFGRHIAVLGTTGGGKSWTLARLMEQSVQFNSKSILIDATGEFSTLADEYVEEVKRVHIGGDTNNEYRDIPYNELLISDLTAIFRPSSQSQAPKLHEAIKSLKLIQIDGDHASDDGLLVKQGNPKAPIEESFREHVETIEDPKATFNINNLAYQIREECVYPTGYDNDEVYGDINKQDLSYCYTLISRIQEIVNSTFFSPIFQPEEDSSIFDEINNFIEPDDEEENYKLLIISLEDLSFQRKIREIVVNAIGRHLHQCARKKKFINNPLVTYLDEAHQFLNQKIRDDFVQFDLDSFESLAKEGRKYGISVCLATQRPRDIPTGILSQVGTLMVHRLINERDRNVVKNACGELDRDVASQLPSLSSGEAVVIGVDFNFPLATKIKEPVQPPDSEGPDYQTFWNVEIEEDQEDG